MSLAEESLAEQSVDILQYQRGKKMSVMPSRSFSHAKLNEHLCEQSFPTIDH